MAPPFNDADERARHARHMEAIGRLAGGIAHDFNNFLNGMIGYADLLRAELHDRQDALQDFADAIVKTGQEATAITNQLLTFSGRTRAAKALLDVHDVVEDAVAELRRTLDTRIALHHDLAARPSSLLGDRALLKSALMNLGLNAQDAIEGRGSLTFATSTRRVSHADTDPEGLPPGQWLRLSATDTGTGIDVQNLQRIFEPFFTTRAKGRGKGLGLATVYGTVMLHGGRVRADNEAGQGARITLFLPIPVSDGP